MTNVSKRAPMLTLALVALATGLMLVPRPAFGQGSRKDDIVLTPSGHPVAGATIRVCMATATGTPCSPLATIYTDATLTVAAENPFQGDGIGNYYFYAPAGRYLLQVSGPGITGTLTYPDVILAPDVSSSGAGNNISAFGLTLGGNLSVAGNANISGTLTTTNFNPGNFTPSSLSVAGNETVAGPRPRTDVTAYGAKGTGLIDDTAAIQAAITAVCAESSNSRSTVFFPPGNYLVSQPQTPSTSPVFTGLCNNLTIEGMGGNGTNQFSSEPVSRIYSQPGASPNAAAVFSPSFKNNITFRDIEIDGYNQAVYIALGGNGDSFRGVNLSTVTTGLADNVPLKLSAVLQFSWQGGMIQAGSGSLDDVLIIGADTGGTETQPAGLIFFDGIGGNFWIGNGIHYSQRVNTCCSGPGDFHFKNILVEDNVGAFFRVTNDTGNPGAAAMPAMHDLTFENIDESDGSTTSAVVNFNSSGSLLTGVWINSSNSGNSGLAVQIPAGTLQNCQIMSVLGNRVVDGSGNPLGVCASQNYGGFDYIANGSDPNRLGADMSSPMGPAYRGALSGNPFASLALDPSQGLLLEMAQATVTTRRFIKVQRKRLMLVLPQLCRLRA